MTIGRYAFSVTVDGADKGARDLDNFAAAERRVSAAGKDAGGGVKSLEGALETVTGPAGKALRVFNDVGDVFRLLAAGIAGGALFGGLQDIAESLKAIYEAARKAWNPELWDHMKVWEEQAKALAKAEEEAKEAIVERIRAQESAGAGGLIGALDTLGGGADPAALDRVIELTRNLAELEQKRADAAAKASQYGSRGASQELIRLQQQIEFARRELRGYTEVGQDISTPQAKARHAEVLPMESGGGLMPTLPGQMTDADARYATAERKADVQAAEDLLTISRQHHEMMMAHMPAAVEAASEQIKASQQASSAVAAMGATFKSSFQGVAETAVNAGGFVVGAVQQMSAAFGQAMANFVIAGETGSGGIQKIAGNVLAGLSAQAFGYAFLLEALAAASALVPILGLPAAGGLAAAGGIMAGAGVALGLTARALGAEPIGGKGSGGRGGGGGASAAGTNPYQPQGGGQTQVTVVIGSEVVTRGVHVEERRQAMRGGISEGRRAA